MAHLFSLGRHYKITISLALLLLVVALLFRVTDLGTFLTADEKNWIGRSYEFIRAFKDWRFNDMLQTTHPGVTTLWLSGLAVTAKILISHVPFSFTNLIYFVKASQFIIALTNAILVPVIYVLLTRLFDQRRDIAFIAGVFIAVDPFIVGYSRVVHVDAMLGGLLFAAALATILYAQSNWQKKWLLTSALLAALALLTKAPAIFMLPYFGLVVLAYSGRQLLNPKYVTDRARELTIWLLLIGLTVVTVWPAILWVPNPEGNVLLLKRDIGRAAITPHHMSEDYQLNSDYYFYTLLTRTTPALLILCLIGLLGLSVTTVKKKEVGLDQKTTWLLVAYVFFFITMMTLGAKKGDRYILPVFFAIDTLAAVGAWYLGISLSRLVSSYTKYHIRKTKHLFLIIALLTCLAVGWTTYRYHPYAIAYSNPLLPDNLSQELGWGEGLEQVGDWLNQYDPDAVVAAWYPEELGAYTTAHVAHINAHRQGRVKYVVLYRNMFGRAPDHYANDFIDEYYKKRTPSHVVKIAGKEFAWIYEKKVYERVVGEITPDRTIEQTIRGIRSLTGFDLQVATYSGQAQLGQLLVTATDENNKLRQKWQIPVSEIEDNQWVEFKFRQSLAVPRLFKVSIKTIGTKMKNAPTVRYTSRENYRDTNIIIDGVAREGDLAVRLRYDRAGQVITEDDDKLLK